MYESCVWLQPNACSESKCSSCNLPSGVQYILLLSWNLFADLICVFFPLPYLFCFSCFPSGAFSCLCLSASKGQWSFGLLSLWTEVHCYSVLLNHLLRAQAAELQPSAHCRITCKTSTLCTYTQMFCSHFRHEGSRQYARKLSIFDGQVTPKRHLYSLCQSSRDRFSFKERWFSLLSPSACYDNTNSAQCLGAADKRPLCGTFSFFRITTPWFIVNTQDSYPGLEKEVIKECNLSELLEIPISE